MILLLCSCSGATKNSTREGDRIDDGPPAALCLRSGRTSTTTPNTISTQGAPLNGRGPREARAMQTESHQPGVMFQQLRIRETGTQGRVAES